MPTLRPCTWLLLPAPPTATAFPPCLPLQDAERAHIEALYLAAVVVDQNVKLSCFTTRPAIYSPVRQYGQLGQLGHYGHYGQLGQLGQYGQLGQLGQLGRERDFTAFIKPGGFLGRSQTKT